MGSKSRVGCSLKVHIYSLQTKGSAKGLGLQWAPAFTSLSPCLKGTVQNKEIQSENDWVLNSVRNNLCHL